MKSKILSSLVSIGLLFFLIGCAQNIGNSSNGLDGAWELVQISKKNESGASMMDMHTTIQLEAKLKNADEIIEFDKKGKLLMNSEQISYEIVDEHTLKLDGAGFQSARIGYKIIEGQLILENPKIKVFFDNIDNFNYNNLARSSPELIEDADFRNVMWGMTREQVKENESAQLVDDDSNVLIYQEILLNSPVKLMYFFTDNDQLETAEYKFNEQNPEELFNIYLSAKESLIEKYGEPKDTGDYTDEREDYIYSDWEELMNEGKIYFWATWEAESTFIEMMLNSKQFDGNYECYIVYSSTYDEDDSKI